jgi:hypothetical protein
MKIKKLDAPFGCCKDRHQNLGEGYIFGSKKRGKNIVKFMLQASKHGIPVIGDLQMMDYTTGY